MAEEGQPAGWYPNPDGPGQRWWNGISWSDSYQADQPPPPVPGSMATPPEPAAIPAPQPNPPAGYTIPPAPAKQAGLAGCLTALLLLFFLGGLVTLAVVFLLRLAFVVPADYVVAPATVVDHRVEVSSDTTSCYPTLEYVVAGQRYRIEDPVSINGRCDPIGSPAEVAYDPSSPSAAKVPHQTAVDVFNVILFIVGAVVLVILVLFVISFIAWRRRRARS